MKTRPHPGKFLAFFHILWSKWATFRSPVCSVYDIWQLVHIVPQFLSFFIKGFINVNA